VKEEAIGVTLHSDPKKVVERAQMLHRDLALQGVDRALREYNAGGHENDVVDV
jgi:broad specificity phosphatase PhoE